MPCPQVGRVLDVLQAGLCEETDGLARLIRRRLRRQSREAGRQGQGGNRNTSRTRELHDRPVFSSKFQGYDPSSSQRPRRERSEEHTSELQSLMRSSYAVFCLKKKNTLTKTYA